MWPLIRLKELKMILMAWWVIIISNLSKYEQIGLISRDKGKLLYINLILLINTSVLLKPKENLPLSKETNVAPLVDKHSILRVSTHLPFKVNKCLSNILWMCQSKNHTNSHLVLLTLLISLPNNTTKLIFLKINHQRSVYFQAIKDTSMLKALVLLSTDTNNKCRPILILPK